LYFAEDELECLATDRATTVGDQIELIAGEAPAPQGGDGELCVSVEYKKKDRRSVRVRSDEETLITLTPSDLSALCE
jgi:hypothetical protein